MNRLTNPNAQTARGIFAVGVVFPISQPLLAGTPVTCGKPTRLLPLPLPGSYQLYRAPPSLHRARLLSPLERRTNHYELTGVLARKQAA